MISKCAPNCFKQCIYTRGLFLQSVFSNMFIAIDEIFGNNLHMYSHTNQHTFV